MNWWGICRVELKAFGSKNNNNVNIIEQFGVKRLLAISSYGLSLGMRMQVMLKGNSLELFLVFIK